MKPINESVQHVLREMGIISEGSQGAKRAMRKRAGQTPEHAGEGDMGFLGFHDPMSKKGIRRSLKRSFDEANQHNRFSGKVYHVVNATGRVKDLDQNLRYLFSGIRDEISVSTGSRDVWKRDGIILSGRGKIRHKFDKDVYSVKARFGADRKVKDQGDYLIPTQGLRRSAKTATWDESFMRLSDVKWETMYISEDVPEENKVIANQYAKEHGLEVRGDAKESIQTAMDESRSYAEEIVDEIADSFLDLGEGAFDGVNKSQENEKIKTRERDIKDLTDMLPEGVSFPNIDPSGGFDNRFAETIIKHLSDNQNVKEYFSLSDGDSYDNNVQKLKNYWNNPSVASGGNSSSFDGNDFSDKEKIIEYLLDGGIEEDDDALSTLKGISERLWEIIRKLGEHESNPRLVARLERHGQEIYDHLSDMGEVDDEDYDDEDDW